MNVMLPAAAGYFSTKNLMLDAPIGWARTQEMDKLCSMLILFWQEKFGVKDTTMFGLYHLFLREAYLQLLTAASTNAIDT